MKLITGASQWFQYQKRLVSFTVQKTESLLPASGMKFWSLTRKCEQYWHATKHGKEDHKWRTRMSQSQPISLQIYSIHSCHQIHHILHQAVCCWDCVNFEFNNSLHMFMEPMPFILSRQRTTQGPFWWKLHDLHFACLPMPQPRLSADWQCEGVLPKSQWSL